MNHMLRFTIAKDTLRTGVAAFAAAGTALALATPLAAKTNEVVRSLSDPVTNVTMVSGQRKIMLELTTPLAYSPAAGPLNPQDRTDPRNLDIAGVRLGMRPREAQATLRAAGYVDSDIHPVEFSYPMAVTTEWASRYGYHGVIQDKIVHELIWRKGGEEVRVTLLTLPDGPIVHEIHYHVEDVATITPDEFTRRVQTKYGEPVNDDPTDMRWCTVKAPRCENRGENEYPLLVVYPQARQVFLLGNDPGRKAALERRFAFDVESRKPTDQAPSF